MKAADSPFNEIAILPTPFGGLNSILGGGIPRRKITEISGIWSVGKSTLALQIVAKSQNEGVSCFYSDSEFSFSKDYATSLGINCSKLELVQEQFAESSLDSIEKWATEHKNGLIVLDSIGSLLPMEEAQKGAEGRSIGLQARLIGSFTRRIVPILAIKNHAFIVLNHSFTDLNSGRLKTSGGAKLEYAKSIWLTLKRSYGKPAKRSSDGKKTVLFIECEIRKNKISPTEGMKTELSMEPGKGFAKEEIIIQKRKPGRPKKIEI